MTRPAPARLLAGLALTGALALTGCSADTGVAPAAGPGASGDSDVAAGGAASCVAGLTYQGTFYLQVDGGPVVAGRSLQGAEVPPCNDTGGGTEQATPIDAAAIEGVDPAYAVVAETGAGPMVYVAEDHAPGLRDADPLPAEIAATLGLG